MIDRSLVALVFLLLGACSDEPGRPAEPLEAEPTLDERPRHGDHNPHHGGVVWMQSDDLHFEVVLDPSGEHRVYFTDAVRTELPAAVAEDVSIVIKRTGGELEERVELAIDEFGESWLGRGAPVENDPKATAVVRFMYRGEPYELEVPFHTKPADPGESDPHVVP
ncbi:MAG TPA: hypothetical protein VEK15_02345 [Vicinamibacteria bacterium]|nr:hypothetical protein [Vicinamibacteria bacterium]